MSSMGAPSQYFRRTVPHIACGGALVRGCLLVERSVPAGFQKIHCSVRLQPEGEVEPERLQMLLGATEASCVVLQTLRNGVTLTAQIDNAGAGTVQLAFSVGLELGGSMLHGRLLLFSSFIERRYAH